MFVLELALLLIGVLGLTVLYVHKQWVASNQGLLEGWHEDHPWRNVVAQVVLLAFVIVYIRLLGIELSMLLAVLVCALAWLLEKVWLARHRVGKPPKWWQEVVDFFPLLFLVWAVRSFVVQPYRVPSDSLQPTLKPGDFLLVKQYSYGVRFPITHWALWPQEGPSRGDIAVFYPPHDHSLFFVKRVIGLPGDRITYQNATLYINGKKMEQTLLGDYMLQMPDIVPYPITVEHKEEQLFEKKHPIYLAKGQARMPARSWKVPRDHYFMMGDNRDFSGDSRIFGMVPREDLVGQVYCIWLSIDPIAWSVHDFRHLIRLNRMFTKVH